MNQNYELNIFGRVDDEVLKQMTRAMEHGRGTIFEASKGALMADNHIGYCLPVGSVVAYERAICVNGVGYDIGCGNKAVRLDCSATSVRQNIESIMDEISSTISFGIGRKNNEKVDHSIFDDSVWSEIKLLSTLKDKAVAQLGTVGGGNHYVDIFTDESDYVWIGVHFGSRGLGHSIATHFVQLAGGKDGIHADPVLFNVDSEHGQTYLKCMEIAGRYAYAGRDWVCQRVAQILRGTIVESVHNHHNFAWREKHFDRDYWVVRKGATPCFPNQKSFVGGSMGDSSYILEGRESEMAKSSLYSTIHGAGRAMGRTEARGKVCRKTGKKLSEGKISRSDMQQWIKEKNVCLRGGDLDEAPQAYKRIEKVLEAHQSSVEVIHVLTPVGVVMAESDVIDPYKD